MIGSLGRLMLMLYVLAGLCLAAGGIVVALQVLCKPSPFPFLISRRVDPHLWGFNLLGVGFMLSLVLAMLSQTPWSREGPASRVIMSAALAWMAVALAMSISAVLTRSRAGAHVSLFPEPDAKLAAWPGAYRAFIALGLAAVCVLGIMVF